MTAHRRGYAAKAHGPEATGALRFSCIVLAGEVPVATGPQDPAVAGSDRLRAGHADREQVIETLKDAFVHGRLTRDELGERTARALVARTRADLTALTADIPLAQAGTAPARPPAVAPRRPLVRATVMSGIGLVIAGAAMWAHHIVDPGATPTPYDSFATPLFLLAVFSAFAAVGIFAFGVAAAVEQRPSRRKPSPPQGPVGRAVRAGERQGGAGPEPNPPGQRPDRGQADLRARKSRQRHIPVHAGQPGVVPA